MRGVSALLTNAAFSKHASLFCYRCEIIGILTVRTCKLTCLSFSVSVNVALCLFMCVCERERERKRECVSVCVCVCGLETNREGILVEIHTLTHTHTPTHPHTARALHILEYFHLYSIS
jgi:hypothetical protein